MKSIFLAFVFGLGFLNSHLINCYSQNQNGSETNITEDVNITIDAATTDENFEDIKTMLLEYGIEANFSSLKRNNKEEITGIKIKLISGNAQSSSQRMSNRPIDKLSFGRKNGNLYVSDDSGLPDMFSMFAKGNFFENDSLISGFDPYDFFNDTNSTFLFNGDSLTIDQIRDRMMQDFSFKNSLSDRFSYLFDEGYDDEQKRYRFVDDPNKTKVIVIDGKISNFKILSKLAEDDKLGSVDVLSPKAAISIYGEKGKDGAIIATTKQ